MRIIALLLAALLLAGCMEGGRGESKQDPDLSSGSAASRSEGPSSAGESAIVPDSVSEAEPPAEEEEYRYIDEVVQVVADRIVTPGMGEYEKAKAAFDYMIEHTALTDPVGLELWRIRGSYHEPPAFVENRSLSAMLYGIGMCEDYAAAFTVLLRTMGLEAVYVPGLTYSAAGTGLVDHSWTIAKIDGVWYHLDCQLEDNVTRHDTIRYRYFMRGDETMYASHRWGRNLIDARLLTAPQNDEIARDFIAPACPRDYETPAPYAFTSAPMPDTVAIQAEIDAELEAYERANEPLEPLDSNIIPPVFGYEGYGIDG